MDAPLPPTSSSPAQAPSEAVLAEILRKDDYLRQRTHPHWSDWEYLINQDLKDALLLLCQPLQGRLLDYGCGGSPYAALLPQFSAYVRADISAGPGIDLVTDARGALPSQPSCSYDVVFSSQVLEHVADPDRYLAEAYRLLRPGGSLVLTTHGFMGEHGCPHDYHRWTGYGLEHQVTKAGFEVEESYKLTVRMRAAIYLAHYAFICHLFWPDQTSPIAQVVRVVRGFYQKLLVGPLNLLASKLPQQALDFSHSEKSSLYIGVGLRARKPQP